MDDHNHESDWFLGFYNINSFRLGFKSFVKRRARRWRRKSRAKENLSYDELFVYKNKLYNKTFFVMQGAVMIHRQNISQKHKRAWLQELQEEWENELLVTKEPDYVLAKLEIIKIALSWV